MVLAFLLNVNLLETIQLLGLILSFLVRLFFILVVLVVLVLVLSLIGTAMVHKLLGLIGVIRLGLKLFELLLLSKFLILFLRLLRFLCLVLS